MPEAAVLTLREAEVSEAAGVIARAFFTDALTVHLYPDHHVRARLTPLMFEAFVRYDQRFGQVDRLPGFTGVASWLRPGATLATPERMAEAGFDDLPDDIPLAQLEAFFGVVEGALKGADPEPHWNLRLLGVDPVAQGSGHGATLLRHGLERADASGHPCFLETFEERNVPFYLRHGFALVVDDVEPVSGLRYWGFRRAPRSPRST